MLLRGYARFSDYSVIATTGAPLYLSESISPPGKVTESAPNGTGEMVRVIGYVIDTTDRIIRFDPDQTWVEIG